MSHFFLLICIFFLGSIVGAITMWNHNLSQEVLGAKKSESLFWFHLYRKQNVEYFYYGVPGDETQSKLIKTFFVKTGIPGERPTPLPTKIGRDYWLITKKYPSDLPETAPYFLELNVPGIDQEPYGPVPYNECGGQCNWVLPGSFGLHGVNGDNERLSNENPGSSGCIRHTDHDITFLYNLLSPETEEIRYYITDL